VTKCLSKPGSKAVFTKIQTCTGCARERPNVAPALAKPSQKAQRVEDKGAHLRFLHQRVRDRSR